MFDVVNLIKTFGYLGIFGIVFAETGLLVGFFLPGDSLLFTAGILAAGGFLDIRWLLIGLFIATLVGDNVGYFIGSKLGTRLFNKPNSFFFRKEHLIQSHEFFERHGGKTVIIARFVPIVRTFTPVVAGASSMTYKKFLGFSIIGVLLWAIGLTYLGYWAGSKIPHVDKYVAPIAVVIIVISLLPNIYNLLKTKERRARVWAFVKSLGQGIRPGRPPA